MVVTEEPGVARGAGFVAEEPGVVAEKPRVANVPGVVAEEPELLMSREWLWMSLWLLRRCRGLPEEPGVIAEET